MTGLWHGPFARATRLTRRVAAFALLLLVTLAPSAVAPAPVAAAECTGWISTLQPPTTIRVLRTRGSAAGQVQTVDFRDYVNIVMPAELGPQHPRKMLRAQAVAIKQYAWYHAMNWRGRSAAGGCYDVVDSTNDQVYSPETKRPAPAHISAVDATWTWSMRRGGRFFASGYRAGADVPCGADVGGSIMRQRSASACARDGKTAVEILTLYYGNVVVLGPDGQPIEEASSAAATAAKPEVPSGLVGFGDSTGDRKGDVIVVAQDADPKLVRARIYPSGQLPEAGRVPEAELLHAQADTLVRAAADLSADGLEDLAVLLRSADGSLRIEVAQAASGATLTAPATWWQGVPGELGWSDGIPLRFVAADVDGDARGDALLLIGSPDPLAPVTMWWLRGTGTSFESPRPWWVGSLDVDGSALIAADIDADGHGDVIVQEDLGRTQPAGTGLRFSVIRAASVEGDGATTPVVPWLDLADVTPAQARIAVTDINRDRRHDLVVQRPLGATGSQLIGLISDGAGFTRRVLWKNATSFRWSVSRPAGADVDGDGRGDVVIMYNLGAGGTRFFRFVSNGSSLRVAGSTTDPTLPWAGTAIY
ncbi:MAG: hypothetical protein FJ038_07220 [Chloroflexi bacterium]|nr:hypothetical protein [Chloroflexota bacterium]